MTETTPDTVAYLILGLAVSAICIGGLIISMAIRYRNLRKDEDFINQLD